MLLELPPKNVARLVKVQDCQLAFGAQGLTKLQRNLLADSTRKLPHSNDNLLIATRAKGRD
eukprot:5480585-Amphidinium_carterae.1